MNTINMNTQAQAMNGQVYNTFSASNQKMQSSVPQNKGPLVKSASEVLENLENNKANLEESVQEIQRLSDLVTGNKLRFNINDELNKVVVTVVDATTNKIIREIPSEDMQRIQVRMKQAIGMLFDEMI